MQITELGNTGLQVSRLGFGLAAIGRPGYINIGHGNDLPDNTVDGMEEHAHKLLDVAWKYGVRYFDTARSYGNAELYLASWLQSRKIKPKQVTVGSKWGYIYTADWKINAPQHEVKVHTLENFKKQWSESRLILRNYLDVYQVHSATLDSGILDNTEVLNVLGLLKTKGIRIGLSLTGTTQHDTLKKAMEIKIDGIKLFEVVQCTWNLLETSLTDILKQAKSEGLGIIVKEAMANGRLASGINGTLGKAQIELLQAKAKKNNMDLDQLALKSVLEQPFADVVLSGAANVDHLISNLTTQEHSLSFEDLEELSEISETPESYWKHRSSLPWN